ncbi:MAG: hypothetical protein KBD64_02585 [Gammaproteobacteria bacterium]|nr:hypothetical protein [Gammaproteobacteria bacterium]
MRIRFSFALLIILAIFSNLLSAAPPSRTINIVNNCPFTVLWGAKGTPIKDVKSVVTCPPGSAFGASCFNNKGYCGQQLYSVDSKGVRTALPISCYFRYPTLEMSSDSNPDYVLTTGASREYSINLVDRVNDAGENVTQYTLNIDSQYDCDSSTGKYNCHSAPCGERLYSNEKDSWGTTMPSLPTATGSITSGACSPDKGITSAFTQAEITFNDKQNDFYDISIINGVNVPISIEPVARYFGNQGMQENFFCKATGNPPTGDPKKMKGCSWNFTPPDGYEKHIFTEIYRNLATDNKTCTTDVDCKSVGGVCGLKYPEDYINYNNKGYCGKPIAYQTLANISPLVVSVKTSALKDLFQLNNAHNIALSDGTGVQAVTNNQLFMCKTDDYGTGYLYLDSCYNYCKGKFPCNEYKPGKTKNSSTACCGCIDWPGVPTDDDVACKASESYSNPARALWLATVKPLVGWLIDGCPDAYEYQYGDKHGTMQCSSKDKAIDPGNNVGYTITFCPSGKGIFPSGDGPGPEPTVTVVINAQDKVDVTSDTTANFSWQVDITPPESAAVLTTTMQLLRQPGDVSVKQVDCDKPRCEVNLINLIPNTQYSIKVSGNVIISGQTIIPRDVYREFATTSAVSIDNVSIKILGDSSLKVDWKVTGDSTTKSTVSLMVNNNEVASQNCSTNTCTSTFNGLQADTTYEIKITASNSAGLTDTEIDYATTQPKSIVIIVDNVFPPSVADMKLSPFLTPQFKCPVGQKHPVLQKCSNSKDVKCITVLSQTIAGAVVGQWVFNQKAPIMCYATSAFNNPVLNNLTAVYNNGPLAFTFVPSLGWQCQQQGTKLVCTQ